MGNEQSSIFNHSSCETGSGALSLRNFCACSPFALNIIFAGWIAFLFYVFAIYDSSGGASFIREFLSYDNNAIRYRALLLFAPFISTVIGYLVNEREKSMTHAVASNDRLQFLNKKLGASLKLLENEIAQRQIAQAGHFESEKNYRLLADNISDVLFIMREDIYLEYISPSVMELMGYEPSELLGVQRHKLLDPTGIRSAVRTLRQELRHHRKTGEVRIKTVEVEFIRSDGSTFWCETRARVLPTLPGEPLSMVGVMRDITKRKLMEEELRNALQYNELLVKEIHHRTKNNLMIIQSILSMESKKHSDGNLKNALLGSENRIVTLSMLHEKLYRSPSATTVNAGEYLSSLANMLHKSFHDNVPGVALELDITEINLDVEYAVPCGLILNELLTNAYQHAFGPNDEGKISVSFNLAPDGNFFLMVKDSGPGMDEKAPLPLKNPGTLGMRLVSLLTKQLKGTLSISRENGTEVLITYPNKKPEREAGLN